MFGYNTFNGPSIADIAAAVNGNNRNGFGDGWWAIIILFALNGGFGFGRNMGGFGFGGVPGWGMFPGYGYPVATQADIHRGFDNQGVTNKLNGLENGLCDGFYSTNTNILTAANNVQSAVQQSITAGMQNTHLLQDVIQQGTVTGMQNFNALSRQVGDCCCENRQGQMQIMNQMDRDTCAITTAIQQQTQAIMQNDNANYRSLHDELVAYRMQDKDDEIAALRSQVQALNLAASQQNQNTYLVNQLRPCPVPSYQVPNPYCCNQGGCCGQ